MHSDCDVTQSDMQKIFCVKILNMFNFKQLKISSGKEFGIRTALGK